VTAASSARQPLAQFLPGRRAVSTDAVEGRPAGLPDSVSRCCSSPHFWILSRNAHRGARIQLLPLKTLHLDGLDWRPLRWLQRGMWWQPVLTLCAAPNTIGSREPEGIWYTPRGDLGRRGAATVRPKEFARLNEGLGENGQALITNMGGKADRRVPAFDLTFSEPRSVSLAWAFADGDLRRGAPARRP
jgi:hypothetical protein